MEHTGSGVRMTAPPRAKEAGLGQDHEVPLPGVVLAVHGVPPSPKRVWH
jgi:hypothetical protein